MIAQVRERREASRYHICVCMGKKKANALGKKKSERAGRPADITCVYVSYTHTAHYIRIYHMCVCIVHTYCA